MTVRDLLTWMLRESGVISAGQVPSSQDINDAFLRINTLLAQWQRKRWFVYHLIDVYTTSTGEAAYYVGPGQSFNIAMRPDKIFSAFFRQFNQIANSAYETVGSAFAVPPVQPSPTAIDYPLRVIPARENYSSITMKGLQSWPQSVWLDTTWNNSNVPVGCAVVYFYPVPLPNQFELHLQFSEVLQSFVNLTDDILLPPEYQSALLYEMIVRTKSAYGLPQDLVMLKLAKDTQGTLRDSNFQMPNMVMPAELTRTSRYNIFSDNADR